MPNRFSRLLSEEIKENCKKITENQENHFSFKGNNKNPIKASFEVSMVFL